MPTGSFGLQFSYSWGCDLFLTQCGTAHNSIQPHEQQYNYQPTTSAASCSATSARMQTNAHIIVHFQQPEQVRDSKVRRVSWPVPTMSGAERIIDVDVAELRQRRTECIDILLICFDLQQFHAQLKNIWNPLKVSWLHSRNLCWKTSVKHECFVMEWMYLWTVFGFHFSLFFDVETEVFQQYDGSRCWRCTRLLHLSSHAVWQKFHFSETTPKKITTVVAMISPWPVR